ncbi:MAG: sugar phosphate isomerase/epimerase family protein [Planctomycetota bacterium]
MNLLAVNQLSTLRWDVHQDAMAYRDGGWDGIGLFRPKLDEVGIEETAEMLLDMQLSVTSLSWAGGFTGSDGRSYDDSLRDAMEAIHQAAVLNAGSLVVIAGGRNNHIRRHARRSLREALKRLAAVAEEFDVQLSMEPFHAGCGLEWSFVNDLETTLDVIDGINSSHLGLVLDTYHLGMDERLLDSIPAIIDRVDLVQLGDGRHSPMGEMNRCLLGEGCIPVEAIVQRLLDHGYRGPLEVEVLGEDVEWLDYEVVLQHTRQFLSRSLDFVGR